MAAWPGFVDVARPESTFWQTLSKGMRGRWHAQRHEDVAGVGIPDVSYGLRGADGWLELKVLPDWPVRPSTIVRIHHFTSAQRAWLKLRGSAGGGRCFLFLRVQDEFLLLSHEHVHLEDVYTRLELFERGHVMSPRMDFDLLVDLLS